MSKRNRKQNLPENGRISNDREKKIQSLKTLYFNRFLIVRYTCALCFFGDVYYALMTWSDWKSWPAILLMALAVPAIWQLGTMYGKRKVRFEWIRVWTALQWLFNSALLCCLVSRPVTEVMPFFADTDAARTLSLGLVGFGFLLLTLSLIRLGRISGNTDRVFRQIHFFEKKYGLYIDSAK